MIATKHRTRRVVDLHHVLPARDHDLTGDRAPHVFHPQPHPTRVRGVAALAVLAVLVASSTFWAFLWWDDGVRQQFFPRRGPGTAVMATLFCWGLLTQIIGPLRIVRALQRYGRLRISLSLRLVVCWGLTGLLTIVWWVASNAISGWFALLAGGLFIPAAVLFRTICGAVEADR